MNSIFKTLFIFFFASSGISNAQEIDSLRFINCYRFTPVNKDFGGISGIEMISAGEFYVISDRSGLFKCGIDYSEKGIKGINIIEEYSELNKQLEGDLESVRKYGSHLLISDEENKLLLLSENLEIKGSVPFPPSYTQHFKSNKGIEAVATRGTDIWMINEKPLSTDNGFLRLSKMDADGNVLNQYRYPYDKGAEGEDGNCVTEILFNDRHSFITLERSFNRNSNYNIIRLWYVSIDTLATSHDKTVKKKCIATLDRDFQCSPGVAIKNLEGMTWLGGKKYLLLVCDNNFLIPETDFYLFRVH